MSDPTPTPTPTPAPAPAPPPTPAPASAAWYQREDFGLPEEARVFAAGKGFADLATMARSHMEADRLLRDRNVLPKPQPDKLGEWEGWSALGWEADPTKFGAAIKPPALKSADKYDQGLHDTFVKAAHEARVPTAHAQKLLDALVGRIDQTHGEYLAGLQAEQRTLVEGLKTEWGGDYEKNRALAGQAMRALGVTGEDAAALEAVMESPRVVKLFHKLGGMLGEDRLREPGGAAGGNGFGGMTPEAATAKQRTLMADPEFGAAMRDPRNPRHEAVKAEWAALSRAKAGAR